MTNASRAKQNEQESHRTLIGAAFAAAATFIVLTGAVTIAETPRQLSTVTESLVATEVFEIMPPAWIEVPQIQAMAPASGAYEDPGLQVTYDTRA
jgi:hypothetical protein